MFVKFLIQTENFNAVWEGWEDFGCLTLIFTWSPWGSVVFQFVIPPSEKDLIAPKPSKPTSLRRWIKRGPEMRKIITLNTDLLSGSSLQNSLISPFLSFDDGVLEPNHKIMKNFYWHFTTTFSIACKPRFARLNLSIKIALKTSGVKETKLRTLCSGRKCRWLEVAFWDARMTRGLSLWGKLS